MKIQLLHSESCHSYQEALATLREVLKELGLLEKVEVILMDTQEKARAYKFLGSPTVKINGVDLEPELERTGNFSLSACRTYIYGDSLYHYPPKQMLLEALKPLRKNKKAIFAGAGSILAACLASFCCIGPLALASLGMGGAACFAPLEKFRFVFIGVTFALLGVSYWLTYKGKRSACCWDNSKKVTPKEVVLWVLTALVIFLTVFPFIKGHITASARTECCKPSLETQ
jgi:hypothetical protein